MEVIKIASFADGVSGGNPAGVVLCDRLPPAMGMQACAREVGFSETAFAARQPGADNWRVRYFSPETEVPFCGHATIALGAVLAETHGPGEYPLILNQAKITVEGWPHEGRYLAALMSPPTRSAALEPRELDATLALFGLMPSQLNNAIPPGRIHAGADHLVIALNAREDLSAMQYDLDAGRIFMRQQEVVTIMLVHRQSDRVFNVRNAFASGGVFEDPATGAAAAAFCGYLRDIRWPALGQIELIQGEDMGSRSLITAEFGPTPGSSVRVSGAIRKI